MKLTAIILLATGLQVTASGYSQKVTLHLKDASIVKMLGEIKKQTGYLFFYKSEELKKSKKISIDLVDADLSVALEKSLAQTRFTYKIVNQTIVLVPRTEVTAPEIPAPIIPFIDVTGKITDKNGTPLSGATVTVKGTKFGTSTNQNGSFTLKNIDQNAVLEISYVGFVSQSINLNNRNDISIVLEAADNSLDETVIIAYGKTSKRLNTGSVSSVTNDVIEKQPVTNPIAALQGRVSGLMITASSGMPGANFQVRIRGENSMKQGNDPLYIIDGVPFISAPLNNFDGGVRWSKSIKQHQSK